MSWKLFLDDERFPVSNDFTICRNSWEAALMTEQYGIPQEIAFDHDLGGEDTSIKYIDALTDMFLDGEFEQFPEGFVYTVHSQNPVEVQNIQSKMNQLIRHFGE